MGKTRLVVAGIVVACVVALFAGGAGAGDFGQYMAPDGSAVLAADASWDEAVAAFTPCDRSWFDDYGDAMSTSTVIIRPLDVVRMAVEDTDRWLAVEDVVVAQRHVGHEFHPDHGPGVMSGTVMAQTVPSEPSPDPQSVQQTEPVDVVMDPARWSALTWALASDGEVFFAMRGEVVLLVLVTTAANSPFFAGECQHDLYETVAGLNPGRYLPTVLRSAPGKHGAALVEAFAPQLMPRPTVEPALTDHDYPEALLADLQPVLAVLRIFETRPASWLCLRSGAGWSECVSTRESWRGVDVDISAYLDDTGVLEVWFFEGPNPAWQRKIGEVVVPTELRGDNAVVIRMNVAVGPGEPGIKVTSVS